MPQLLVLPLLVRPPAAPRPARRALGQLLRVCLLAHKAHGQRRIVEGSHLAGVEVADEAQVTIRRGVRESAVSGTTARTAVNAVGPALKWCAGVGKDCLVGLLGEASEEDLRHHAGLLRQLGNIAPWLLHALLRRRRPAACLWTAAHVRGSGLHASASRGRRHAGDAGDAGNAGQVDRLCLGVHFVGGADNSRPGAASAGGIGRCSGSRQHGYPGRPSQPRGGRQIKLP
mmetsp:Transcript_25020/g.79526  ORF Transcript_25020/g.79526 Transcript_25020/m.79526 type:complete len:229 (+) Transcript_25020:1870-2556(+)